jgi:hypothetical protein
MEKRLEVKYQSGKDTHAALVNHNHKENQGGIVYH